MPSGNFLLPMLSQSCDKMVRGTKKEYDESKLKGKGILLASRQSRNKTKLFRR